MNVARGITCGLVTAALVGAAVLPAEAQSVKSSKACRKEIGAKFSKLAQTDLAAIEGCHKLRDKGKLSGDCNDLGHADVKGAVAKAEAAATKGIAKKCLDADPVRFNYDQHDPEGAFVPTATAVSEAAATTIVGSPDLQGDKTKIKCHAAIAKALSKDVGEILKSATKCQAGLDKLAVGFSDFAALDGDCVLAPVKAGPKGEKGIIGACCGKNKICSPADTGENADTLPEAVDTCTPLPTCVTASATTAGQAIAHAIYGSPVAGCGNLVIDSGEQCDDGNDLTTDACIACQQATCGDGFVRAGVEVCGDSTTDACTAPSESTCQVTPCAAAGTTRSVTVRFTKPADLTVGGLVIALDYPETAVRIPGTGGDAQVTDRVTIVASGLTTILDRDYEVQVTVAGFPSIDPGDFFSVSFDDCAAVDAPTLDQFACIVKSASDDSGNQDITAQVKCSVTSP